MAHKQKKDEFWREIAFLHKILMSRTTELYSEIHFIMLIHTHFPYKILIVKKYTE